MCSFSIIVMYHSTFKRGKTGKVVYTFNIDTIEIIILFLNYVYRRNV